MAALITLTALWAAFDSARPWEGEESLAALVMFGVRAVVARCATGYCFSRERTFADFIHAVDGDETDTLPNRRQPSPEGGSLTPQ